MKRSLLIGLLAFLFFYALSYALYVWLLKSLSVNMLKQENFTARYTRSGTWYMGDSHPLQAVLADSVPGAFNWASSSESYALTYFKIKDLLEKGYHPNRIVLPLEYHSFSAQGCALWLGHELDDVFWSSMADFNDPDWQSEFTRWYVQARLAPFAGQFYKLSRIGNRSHPEISNAGHQKSRDIFCQNPDSAGIAGARIKSHFGKFHVVDSTQIRFLNKILNLAAGRGIQVVLVRYPLSELYLKSVQSLPCSPLLERTIRAASSGYKVLDFRTVFRNQPAYFSDPDHLNDAGAARFTRILNKEI